MPLPMTSDLLAVLAAELRPRLHRYCARMVGSALDGEDIVQDALLKAAQHFDPATVQQPQAWLFRVAHNTALDFLRRRSFERTLLAEEPIPESDAGDAPAAAEDQRDLAETALRTFVRLPLSQRTAIF